MKKLTPINSFKDGDVIQGFFLCTEKYLRHSRNGNIYLDLKLRDVTGQINAKIWKNIPALDDKFKSGDAVAISGSVESFMNQNQLIINKINKATVQYYGRYGFDPEMIVPSSKKNPQKMWKELTILINSIKNKDLRELVNYIYRLNKKKLMVLPSSLKMHYSFRSGFLEHVLNIAKVAKKIGPLYNVDVDLLLTGVLIHDIGKLNGISSKYVPSYTKEGTLLGHVVIGRDMVKAAIERNKKFPKELSLKLEHIILSHRGQYEWKSPKLPAFPEALLVHMIDMLDSRMNLMGITLDEDLQPGDFTNQFNSFGIPLFKKDGT